jgi:hypothetical protein
MRLVMQMVNTRNVIGRYDMAVVLKAQVDNLTGRNDELRRELRELRFEASKAQEGLNRANAKVSDSSAIMIYISSNCTAGKYIQQA